MTGTSGGIVSVTADVALAARIADALEHAGLPQRLRLTDVAEVPETAALVVLGIDDEGGAFALEQPRLLRERLDELPLVVVVPDGSERRLVRSALRARVEGLLTVAQIERGLGATVRAVLSGLTVVPRRERAMLVPALSYRERQVLALVTLGYANSQVAERLFLSESTVKSHLTSVFAKLGVASRREAATLVLDPDEPVGRTVLSTIQPDAELAADPLPWA
ncbi:MAG TPA: LuxR C-terminal-related transcriptional regulator [Conexibacter sp.]|nr:LuxR C-terminal-related transcriptional regulator [Conexibacter sp.]